MHSKRFAAFSYALSLITHCQSDVSVEEVQVVRNFNETHSLLDEPAAEQAALPEFAAVAITKVGMPPSS